jgi:molybdopterin biosynthesis enzyme
MLRVLAEADALLIRAADAPALARGAEVEVIPLAALGV